MNKKVEIAIILFSNEGQEINFRELKSGESYLGQEEWTSDFFWGARGGFELIVDGYKAIFRGFEFYVAIHGIRFLLDSLHWLKGETNRYKADQEFSDAVVSRFPNNHFIKLSRTESGLLSFSYQPAVSILNNDRGNRFFKDEQFLPDDWAAAAKIGLKEFFDVLHPILLDNKEQKASKILENYLLKDWEELKN